MQVMLLKLYHLTRMNLNLYHKRRNQTCVAVSEIKLREDKNTGNILKFKSQKPFRIKQRNLNLYHFTKEGLGLIIILITLKA